MKAPYSLKDWIKFWNYEWRVAEKEGNIEYAIACKEEYRIHVIESLKRPWNQHEEKLKQFPILMLN